MQTTVKWFNVTKGYGFLENGTGPDIYVNAKSLRSADKMNTGDLVEFECHVFEGKLVARHVRQVRREGTTPSASAVHGNGNGNGNGNAFENNDNYGNREQPMGRMQKPRFVMQ